MQRHKSFLFHERKNCIGQKTHQTKATEWHSMTQWDKNNRKWIENEHLPTLIRVTLIKVSLCLEGRKVCGILKLICDLRHTYFTNLRFRQILNLGHRHCFIKICVQNRQILHSVVCGNTFIPPAHTYKAFLRTFISDSNWIFLKWNFVSQLKTLLS